MEKYKILFLSSDDPIDKRSWSGIQNCMFKEMSRYFRVYPAGPIKKNWKVLVVKIFKRLMKKITTKVYNADHSILIGKNNLNQIKNKLNKNYDLIFASCSSREVSQLITDIPIILSIDATFNLIKNYYPEFSNLLKYSEAESEKVELAAITKASIILCSSQWAAKSATDFYQAEKSKVQILPYGANIDEPAAYSYEYKSEQPLFNILFLGVDWERKGGPIVFKTFELLSNKYSNLQLTICGVNPSIDIGNLNIRIIPFLDKNLKNDLNEFKNMMVNTHLLFIPTRADCTPIAFSEAAAYGIPIITTDTGGVSSIVEDGVNGYCLPYNADITQYVEIVSKVIENKALYKSLSESSRKIFEEKLNWEKWGLGVKGIIEDVISAHRG